MNDTTKNNNEVKSIVEETMKNVKTVSDTVQVVTTLIERIMKLEHIVSEMKQPKTRKVRETRNMSEEDIRTIFKLNKEGMSGYKISKQYDTNPTYIYNILNRNIYKDIDVSDIIDPQPEQNEKVS